MVFMSVCDNKTFYTRGIIDHIRKVRNNDVYAEHVIFRESHAAVYYEHLILILKDRHILSDLIKPPYRDDFHVFRTFLYLILVILAVPGTLRRIMPSDRSFSMLFFFKAKPLHNFF